MPSPGYDYLLVVGSSIWKQQRTELPMPGTQIFLHRTIPLAAVVSIVEDPGQPSGAALLRFPEPLTLEVAGTGFASVETLLLTLGWTALVPRGLSLGMTVDTTLGLLTRW